MLSLPQCKQKQQEQVIMISPVISSDHLLHILSGSTMPGSFLSQNAFCGSSVQVDLKKKKKKKRQCGNFAFFSLLFFGHREDVWWPRLILCVTGFHYLAKRIPVVLTSQQEYFMRFVVLDLFSILKNKELFFTDLFM